MPVWIAASSENALDWAGEQGFSIMMDPHATQAEIAGKRKHYEGKLADAGHPVKGRDIPMARTLAMADTAEKATEVGRRGADFMFGSYLRKKENIYGTDAGGQKTMQLDAINKTIRDGGDPVAKYVDEVAICGDPAKVIDDLQEMEETLPLEYLMIAPLSHGSFVTFTEKVMPKFL
jgi:alkanesulfonate monooxygenase SsuD/methylene tetrahydromethanopterin reductase-like flavin-dependent oxidoreductase (luciferase family)